MPPPTPDTRLAAFLTEWSGCDVPGRRDPRPLADAHEVALLLAARGRGEDVVELRRYVEPIFVHDDATREDFARLWERHFQGTIPAPDTTPSTRTKSRPEPPEPTTRGWQGVLLTALLLILSAGALLLAHQFQVNQQPPALPLQSSTTPSLPPPAAAAPTPIPEPFRQPATAPDESPGLDLTDLPSVSPFLRPLPWHRALLYQRTWWDAGALALGLALFAIVLRSLFHRAWLRDRVDYLSRRAAPKGAAGRAESFFLGLSSREWRPDALIAGVASRFRRHLRTETTHLDGERTVGATIRRGGFFTPVRAERAETPEYLFLVEEKHRQDHLGRMVADWIGALRAHGVEVAEYRFISRPDQLFRAEDRGPADLRDVVVRHPRHRVVLFGQGLQAKDPLTGVVSEWVTDLERIESERVVLSPASFTRALGTDQIRERGWTVFDFSESGVRSLGDWLIREGGPGPVPAGLEIPVELIQAEADWMREDRPVPDRRWERLERDLTAWLGADGMLWLRACAVFPVVDWHLTRYLGQELPLLRAVQDLSGIKKRRERIERARAAAAAARVDEATFWKLAQLPWLRRGRMPEWLREHLLAGLDAAEQDTVTLLVHLAMERARDRKAEKILEILAKRPDQLRRVAAAVWHRLSRKFPELEDELVRTALGRKKRTWFELPRWAAAGVRWTWPVAATAASALCLLLATDGWEIGFLVTEPGPVTKAGQTVAAVDADGNTWTYVPPGRFRDATGLVHLDEGFWSGKVGRLERAEVDVAINEALEVRAEALAEEFGDLDRASPQEAKLNGREAEVTLTEWRAGRLGAGWKYAEPTAAEREHAKQVGVDLTEGAVLVGDPDYFAWAGKAAGERRLFDVAGNQVPFRWCPPGVFLMGSPPWEIGRDSDEGPRHPVRLTQGVWIAETETTQAVWGKGGSSFVGPDRPVENVSWEEVTEFAAKLPASAGGRFVLPTEAQWEYACRAGTRGSYNMPGELATLAWFRESSDSSTHPVGTKLANAWGLHDMHGNVWEWCADWYAEFASALQADPEGPASGSNRVDRGGSWLNTAAFCRSAIRFRDSPDYRYGFLGFRLACSSTLQPQAEASLARQGRRGGEAQQPPKPSAQGLATRTITLAPGVTMDFQYIPPGKFVMGSPEGTGDADEHPAHEVEITKGFWMARTETTQAQWQAIMGTTVAEQKAKPDTYGDVTGTGADHPMYFVNWEEAVEFGQKLEAALVTAGVLEPGWKLVLPTEAQWEYACRAGTTGDYNGDQLEDLGWFDGNSGSSTHPVAAKQANAWGLHDMHGNVWEWCADWYAEYASGLQADPQGPASGSLRVFRGGSWGNAADYCRSAYRDWFTPGYRGDYFGFRLACSSTPEASKQKANE